MNLTKYVVAGPYTRVSRAEDVNHTVGPEGTITFFQGDIEICKFILRAGATDRPTEGEIEATKALMARTYGAGWEHGRTSLIRALQRRFRLIGEVLDI